MSPQQRRRRQQERSESQSGRRGAPSEARRSSGREVRRGLNGDQEVFEEADPDYDFNDYDDLDFEGLMDPDDQEEEDDEEEDDDDEDDSDFDDEDDEFDDFDDFDDEFDFDSEEEVAAVAKGRSRWTASRSSRSPGGRKQSLGPRDMWWFEEGDDRDLSLRSPSLEEHARHFRPELYGDGESEERQLQRQKEEEEMFEVITVDEWDSELLDLLNTFDVREELPGQNSNGGGGGGGKGLGIRGSTSLTMEEAERASELIRKQSRTNIAGRRSGGDGGGVEVDSGAAPSSRSGGFGSEAFDGEAVVVDAVTSLEEKEGEGNPSSPPPDSAESITAAAAGTQNSPTEKEREQLFLASQGPPTEEGMVKVTPLRSYPLDPDCKQVWASAVYEPMSKHVHSILSMQAGVEVCANYDDWEAEDADALETLDPQTIATLKAMEVYARTGLPAVAERTTVVVAPKGRGGGGKGFGKSSGYYFSQATNNPDVDKLLSQLTMFGDDSRVVQYYTEAVYYDGQQLIHRNATAQVALCFVDEFKPLISIGTALDKLTKALEVELGLQSETKRVGSEGVGGQGGGGAKEAKTFGSGDRPLAASSSSASSASARFRERVLKDARVLPNNIVDVSSFMDSMVDVDLMDGCAEELAEQFMALRPTKVLTVATSGLLLAIPLGRILQVPVVYARKERSVVMADVFSTPYASNSFGTKHNELLLAKDTLHSSDRVLLADDFLSSGSAQQALLRLVGQAGATPCGVCALIEKVYDRGRVSLSGFNIPVESVCQILDVENGQVNVA